MMLSVFLITWLVAASGALDFLDDDTFLEGLEDVIQLDKECPNTDKCFADEMGGCYPLDLFPKDCDGKERFCDDPNSCMCCLRKCELKETSSECYTRGGGRCRKECLEFEKPSDYRCVNEDCKCCVPPCTKQKVCRRLNGFCLPLKEPCQKHNYVQVDCGCCDDRECGCCIHEKYLEKVLAKLPHCRLVK